MILKHPTFILIFALLGCQNQKPKIESEASTHYQEEDLIKLTPSQLKNAGIEFGKVEMKSISSTISCNGVLDVPPQNMVSVSALMGGFIKTTELLQGLKVRKGQIIATIQNPEFIKIQSAYLENKSRLFFLEQEYNRQEELSRNNVTASKIFQQVTSEYNSLQATVGALEEELKILNIDAKALNKNNIRSIVNIYSPINGHITVVNINIGKYVNPQDVICEIVDTDHLHAELTVFEKDIIKIKEGQKIRFALVNENGKERTAKVYLINRQISSERTIRVHAHLDKEDPYLMPNMYLKASIEVGEGEKSTVLPEQAIVTSGDKYFIFVKSTHHDSDVDESVSEDKNREENESGFKVLEIQKGFTQNGFTEVVLPKGFDKTQDIVIKGAYDLLSKMNNSEEEEHSH